MFLLVSPAMIPVVSKCIRSGNYIKETIQPYFSSQNNRNMMIMSISTPVCMLFLLSSEMHLEALIRDMSFVPYQLVD